MASVAPPDEYRLVAAQYCVEKLSYQKIADVVAGSVGTVHSWFVVAGEGRKKLSGDLQQFRVLAQVFALIRSHMAPIDRYTCEETFRRLDDYLDRELTPHEMQLVKEHLEVCATCASEYAFEASALERLRDKLQRIAAPADLMAQVSRALQQAQGKASSQ